MWPRHGIAIAACFDFYNHERLHQALGYRAPRQVLEEAMQFAKLRNPFSGGVALIGDAAGASDPTRAQGLSITTRDVRVLTEMLNATDDWNEAGHAYARVRDEYFGRLLKVTGWFSSWFSPREQKLTRCAQALPLIAQEPERVPEHLFGGPDLPCDETVRRRFFGEERDLF